MSDNSVSLKLLQNYTLISQGAEAKVYKGSLATGAAPILLKYRFRKTYRHATLDVSLTKSRVAGEARALMKCLRSGVNVPGVRMVDATEGLLGIEWIDGTTVKQVLPSGADDEDDGRVDQPCEEEVQEPLEAFGISREALMDLIGYEIAKMHSADIIHGDLTTSNMMLRLPSSTSNDSTALVLIDFGLSYHSSLVEDKAVDLYVLERAFASTHPDSEPMFALILSAYASKSGKDWHAVKKRLGDVRLRGRKRSMVG